MNCFENGKSIVVHATRFQSFKISEGKGKLTLDFKYQKLKIVQGKNKTRVAPTWSQKLKQTERFQGKKDRKGRKTLLFTSRGFFSKSDTLSKHSCSPFHNFPFPTTNFGYVF
jgi:hypothetical protein